MRIFPDQIAVNSHEPELTAQEVTDGQAYWNGALAGRQSAGRSRRTRKAPWRTLASLYTPQRAAWIALQLTPTNPAAQPAAAAARRCSARSRARLPRRRPRRDSSWEQPAIADALPDAWTVVLVQGTQTSTLIAAAPSQTR